MKKLVLCFIVLFLSLNLNAQNLSVFVASSASKAMEEVKNEFLKSAQNLKILFKAILPDAEARRYAKIVFVSTILYSKIKESLAKFVDKTEIKSLALQVEELLNESITLASYQINAVEKLDLSKIDFEELQKKLDIALDLISTLLLIVAKFFHLMFPY